MSEIRNHRRNQLRRSERKADKWPVKGACGEKAVMGGGAALKQAYRACRAGALVVRAWAQTCRARWCGMQRRPQRYFARCFCQQPTTYASYDHRSLSIPYRRHPSLPRPCAPLSPETHVVIRLDTQLKTHHGGPLGHNPRGRHQRQPTPVQAARTYVHLDRPAGHSRPSHKSSGRHIGRLGRGPFCSRESAVRGAVGRHATALHTLRSRDAGRALRAADHWRPRSDRWRERVGRFVYALACTSDRLLIPHFV